MRCQKGARWKSFFGSHAAHGRFFRTTEKQVIHVPLRDVPVQQCFDQPPHELAFPGSGWIAARCGYGGSPRSGRRSGSALPLCAVASG